MAAAYVALFSFGVGCQHGDAKPLRVQDYGQLHGWSIPPLSSASGHAHAWVGEEIARAFGFVAFSSVVLWYTVVHVILMYPLVN